MQLWLYSNRQTLRQAGLAYPEPVRSPEEPKHAQLVAELRHDTDLPVLKHMLGWAGNDALLISDEGLSNHLVDFRPEALKQFRKATDEYDTVLILVRRDNEAWLKSYHKQCVLNPANGSSPFWGTASTADEMRSHPRLQALMNIGQLTRDLTSAFGAQDVMVLNYDTPDWVDRLQEGLGIRPAAVPAPERSNESVPEWVIALLARLNATAPDPASRQHHRAMLQAYLNSSHSILLSALDSDERPEPTAADAEAVRQVVEEGSEVGHPALNTAADHIAAGAQRYLAYLTRKSGSGRARRPNPRVLRRAFAGNLHKHRRRHP